MTSGFLAINPGSTSTKFGIFADVQLEKSWTLRHRSEELLPFKGRPVLEQMGFRLALIEGELSSHGVQGLSAVVGRGGLLPPLDSGTCLVDDAMLDYLRLAPRGEHASNLGAPLARAVAAKAGVEAFIVDP